VASYTDPGGSVSYGFDTANVLTSLIEPGGAKTTFGYNNAAVRTSTTYPGGTVLANNPDNSMRTQEIKATNGSNVFSDLAYSYANGSGDTSLAQARTECEGGLDQVRHASNEFHNGRWIGEDLGQFRVGEYSFELGEQWLTRHEQ